MAMFGYAKGWTEIGTQFGATGRRAREWFRAGAPIILIGEKPVTRLDDLWYWLLENGAETEAQRRSERDIGGKYGNHD